jgi:uncharacterized protein HemX
MNEEEQTTKETTQQEEAQTLSSPEPEEKSTGAIIGTIIIVVLLVIGGLYFFGQRVTKEPTPEEIISQPDVVTETLDKQGTSDKIVDITADLGTENDLKNLDVELGNIDAELNF